MVDNVVEQTNLFSVQNTGNSTNLVAKEFDQLLGMFFHMGLVRMDSIRQYWETDSRYDPVASVMSRNRFQKLLMNLHFVDNLSIKNDEKADKLWKLRPWISGIRTNCLKINPGQCCAVDEMMYQYHGTSSPIRQYIKSKPHPYGFKIWGIAGTDGLLHDFDVYQGGDGTRSELGQGSDVVLKLTSTFPHKCWYKVYADNLFTCAPLLVKLKERGMLYTGTVRQNRMAGCELKAEQELKRDGRGSYDTKTEITHNISAVRWYDNRVVTLMSTASGVDPIGKAKRWNKAAKEYKEVTVPAVIVDYNQNMGGIDRMDSYLAKYRCKLRSRRWYMYLFWHFVMVAAVNAWLLYRREYSELGLPKKNQLSRRRFQAILATSLIKVQTCNIRKRGRPSAGPGASSVPSTSPAPTARKTRSAKPAADVQYDGVEHWPGRTKVRGRCTHCKINNTTVVCKKCNVCLCFVSGRNCFKDFHMK